MAECVCVCDRIFAGADVLGDTEIFIWFFIAPSSLTSHIIKSSCINYTLLVCKIKERSFPSHAIYLSQFLSLIFTWTSRFFLVS
jgi:hypothetical protein